MDNYNNYKLSYETNDRIIHHLKDEDVFSTIELENAIVNAKKHELRKLFFYENPELFIRTKVYKYKIF